MYVFYAVLLILLAALPTLLVFRNLPLFRRAPASSDACEAVSVLIPARDEEAGIAEAIESVLANSQVEMEVIVMDDHSTDQTAQIVNGLAKRDNRVRLAHAPELPDGWNGKQHACWQLAQLANFDLLLFMDADVRLSPDALHRMGLEKRLTGVALLSGFPRQVMVTLAEKLLVPMMYFVLLGYLPLARMRASPGPEFGAGCGQLFLADKAAYQASGGHGSISSSRHDGLKLPRSFRAAGFATDLFDASDIARVRMYSGWSSVLRGLMKNANEGIANGRLILPFSILLLGSAVLPTLSLAHALFYGWSRWSIGLLVLASLLSFAPRAMIARRLGQSWIGVLLHPLAVAIFVALQWIVWIRDCLGMGQVSWKGRQ
jgi:hypothetical protein